MRLRAGQERVMVDSREKRAAFFIKIVCGGMVLALAVSFLLTHLWPKGWPYNTFLFDHEHRFMDFSNVNYVRPHPHPPPPPLHSPPPPPPAPPASPPPSSSTP